MNYQKELEDLLMIVAKEGASDLHISVGRHPTIRVAGGFIPLVKKQVLTPEDTAGLVFAMLNEDRQKELFEKREIDFSYNFQDKVRFRANAFYQRGFFGIALRLIPVEIKDIKSLNLPETLLSFTRKGQGFFLLVGPNGHGKSTTLASMIDVINHERAEHIITVEDPIEYIFIQDKSIIDQREVRSDTHNFKRALKSMFREDVNVAMVGEMRDYETISRAGTAAETGHLIFSSLHTNNAAQTIDRIIDSFPPIQQNQIRSQLASTIIGIFSQRLIPRVSGGLIPAYELLIANHAIRNLIRENKVHEIDMVIETSSDAGMISFSRSLMELVRQGEITMENALAYSLNPSGLQALSK